MRENASGLANLRGYPTTSKAPPTPDLLGARCLADQAHSSQFSPSGRSLDWASGSLVRRAQGAFGGP